MAVDLYALSPAVYLTTIVTLLQGWAAYWLCVSACTFSCSGMRFVQACTHLAFGSFVFNLRGLLKSDPPL